MKKMFESMETGHSPDTNRVAGCCPELMEQFLNKMRGCFEERTGIPSSILK
jgi:hypothetical protein